MQTTAASAAPAAGRSLAALAREAMAVQNACNLSGVLQAWARSIIELRPHVEAAGGGTTELNRHPINRVWSDKVASLTGTQAAPLGEIMAAFDAVEKLAQAGG
jgi:hypothetical protein